MGRTERQDEPPGVVGEDFNTPSIKGGKTPKEKKIKGS